MPRVIPTTPSAVGLYASAGPTLPSSGVSSTDGSGPYMIEEQWMDFDYVRVPYYEPSATSFNLTKPTCDYRVGNTHMLVHVKANYQRTKVYAYYTSPTWTQTQKFEYLSLSCDAYDNCDYGEVGPSALGPQGSVVTKQKWFFRRPWASTDTTALETMDGTRHFYGSYGTTFPTATGPSYEDGIFAWGDFKRSRWSYLANTFLEDSELQQWAPFFDYQLGGSYSTNKETPLSIQLFINNLGQQVTNENYYIVPYSSTTSPPNETEGFPEYSVTRHDFS